ncbi:UreD-domain-containing protein, partial [Ceraceosorus guamensis]
FSSLYASFPLKLLHPRVSSQDASRPKAVAALYVVSYGGGLVSGDEVLLDVDVGQGCALIMLTQGSTKVFRMRSATLGVQRRPNIEQASTLVSNDQHAGSPHSTRQVMRYLVRPNATLVLLPDPVTCFAGARYTQVQRFDLRCADTSSLVMLDWFTPGRRSELWAFDSYRSRNELRVAGRLFARDVMLLEQSSLTQLSQGGQPTRAAAPGLLPLSVRCHPYTTYATLLLVGPDCEQAIHHLKAEFAKIEQGVLPASKQPDDLIWSLSELHCEPQQSDLEKRSPLRGAIVRVAGTETQTVRAWLAKHLQSMVDVVGPDLYRQAL